MAKPTLTGKIIFAATAAAIIAAVIAIVVMAFRIALSVPM